MLCTSIVPVVSLKISHRTALSLAMALVCLAVPVVTVGAPVHRPVGARAQSSRNLLTGSRLMRLLFVNLRPLPAQILAPD